jgi:NAD(P)-dependent dehydrogenase (short-subunit alcohol dehydrogenase family)
MATCLITGCSRGLGLALATGLAKVPGNKIFATSHGEAPSALNALIESSHGGVTYAKLDVTSRSSTQEAEKQIAALLDGKGIDVLINNAAVINWVTDGIHAM